MDWLKQARETGFEDVCILNMDCLHPLQEVRDMCSADRCRVYGTRWSCPPACGSIEKCACALERYSGGILVQTVGVTEDSLDIESIGEAQKLHNKRFAALVRQVRRTDPGCLPLSAGPCTRCEVCTYPERPCRYPGKMLSSMEAYGLLVSDVCERSGMPYNRGEDRITFTSCILFNLEENIQ